MELFARSANGAVAWVDLAEIREPSAVAPAIEKSIGASGDGTLATDAVIEALRPGPRVIVLDNCEHLVDASRDSVARVLAADTDVRIVATSRVALDLSEEVVFRVPMLSVPEESAAETPGLGIRADSVRLFVERARSAQPDFVLDELTSKSVTEICRHLDGLALSVELAAARLRHMTLMEIASGIRTIETLDANRADSSRHGTMTSALDWSSKLLNEHERVLLRRLAIFAGGFTGNGAQAAAGSELPELLETLAGLVDKSLVEFSARDERYRLLEPVRQYAEARLIEHGEAGSVTDRAARYLVELVTETHGLDRGIPRADLLVRPEFANAAALMPHLIRHDPGAGLRVMARFAVRYRSAVPVHLSVVRTWLERGLASYPTRDAARAEALYAFGLMVWTLDRDGAGEEVARRSALESLSIVDEVGDDRTRAQARWFMALLTASYGSVEEALHAYDTVIPTLRWPRLEALAYSRRSVLRQRTGDTAGADADIQAAFASWDRADDELMVGRGLTMICAAEILFISGRPNEAAARAREAIAAQRSTGEPLEAAPFVALAHLAAATGDNDRAVRLAGIADRLKQEVGSWLERRFALTDGSWLPAVEERLGSRASRLRLEGRRMPTDLAVAYALGERTPTVLTEREEAVAKLVADGLTDKEIGAHLRISNRTAENHVQRVRDKLGLRSRAQIARWFAERSAIASSYSAPSSRG